MNAVVDIASPHDDEGVRRLVRSQTMPGRVRMAFCREPNFAIGCAVTGDEYQILVARASDGGEIGEIVGVTCRSTRVVFMNGRQQRIGYLGQLRIDERYRGRWLLSRGFAMLERLHRSDPLPAYLMSIVEGNDEARTLLVDKRRRSFPHFRDVARYVTLAIRVRRLKAPLASDVELAPASSDQLDELAAFLQLHGARRQLCSVWTPERLLALGAYGLPLGDIRVARRRGAIAGVLALWDQSAYKQSVIRGYSGWLRPIAPMLPRPGTQLRHAYAALACVANDDRAVYASLLRNVYNLASARGIEHILAGFDVRDPLLPAARTYRHLSYPSRLYLASLSDGVDGSTGGPSHELLDAGPTYVDISTL
jgi:hypothetical protein